MFRSLMHKADDLNEKSRSIKSDFSTLRKTRAHVQNTEQMTLVLDVGEAIGTEENSGQLKIVCPFLREKAFSFLSSIQVLPCRK